MKKPLLSLILVLSIVSCGQTTSKTTTDSTSTATAVPVDTTVKQYSSAYVPGDGDEDEDGETVEIDSTMLTKLHWANDLMYRYAKLSENEGIKLALQHKDTTVNWLWQNLLITDTANYIIFNVGHTVTDEDGSSPRYINLQWVYLDTITRQIYEYDLPSDQLVKWDK